MCRVGRLTLLYHTIHGLVHTAGLGEATSMINFIFMVYICAQLNSDIKRQDRAFAQCKAADCIVLLELLATSTGAKVIQEFVYLITTVCRTCVSCMNINMCNCSGMFLICANVIVLLGLSNQMICLMKG